MKDDDDRDLRRRFMALREEDTREAPGFAALWRRAQARPEPRPPRRRVRWLLVAGATCAVFLAAVERRPRSTSRPTPAPPSVTIATPSLGEWRPPTDFLLQTPALEILTTVPALGESMPPPALPFTERSRPS